MPDFQEPIVPVVSPGQVLPPGAGGPNITTSQTSSTTDLLGIIRTLASPSASKDSSGPLGAGAVLAGQAATHSSRVCLGRPGTWRVKLSIRDRHVLGSFRIDFL